MSDVTNEMNTTGTEEHTAIAIVTAFYNMLQRDNLQIGSKDPTTLAIWIGVSELATKFVEKWIKSTAHTEAMKDLDEDEPEEGKPTVQ